MIKVIKLRGGLGNQLFQYSFGKSLGLKFDCSIFYDKFDYIQNDHHTGLLLHEIDEDIKYATSSMVSKYIDRSLISRAMRKLNIYPEYLSERNNEYDSKILTSEGVYYDGYWQSYLYFDDVWQRIQFELNSNSHNFESVHLDSISINNSVSIHIRRGDYLTTKNSQLYFSLNKDYYIKAIDYFASKYENYHFYVFSDDPGWVENSFLTKYPFTLVSSSLIANPLSELYLMSRCKHNIIANSTFSWWGAWLNKNDSKVVICPLKWYRKKPLPKSIYPPNWIVL